YFLAPHETGDGQSSLRKHHVDLLDVSRLALAAAFAELFLIKTESVQRMIESSAKSEASTRHESRIQIRRDRRDRAARAPRRSRSRGGGIARGVQQPRLRTRVRAREPVSAGDPAAADRAVRSRVRRRDAARSRGAQAL